MQTSKNLALLFFAVFANFVLTGCNNQISQAVNAEVADQYKDAAENLERAKNPAKQVKFDTVDVSKGIWLGDKSVSRKNRQPLPKKFETDLGITLVTDSPEKIQEIANQITGLTGLAIEFDDSVEVRNTDPMELSYTGSLSGLLNKIGTETGINWYFDNNRIVFFKTQTKTFTIYSLATKSSYNSNMSLGQEGDTADSLTTNIELNEWEDIKTELSTLVPDGGATVSVSTGTITITGTPATIEKVSQYVKEKNRRLSQMVSLTIKVLLVTIQDSNTVGIDLNAVFQNASGLRLGTGSSGVDTAGNAISAYTNPFSDTQFMQNGNMAIIGGTGTLGDFDGTTAALQALAKQGQISVVTTATVTTRNNRIAPVNNTTTFEYIREITASQLTTDVAQYTPTPGKETVGFNLQLLPNIFENGRLLLMFKMSLRELLSFDTFLYGDQSIKYPRIEERAFLQEAVLKSGQTLVLTGFERASNNDTRYGVGDPDFMALGGGRDTASERNILVIMITPQIIASPLDPEERHSESWGTPSY
ncbi:MAG: hypothetical protein LBR35_01655 [Rickettsiales bacterium]|jgi:type IVB pilus formation R64 PilN family outer membrane protein|nr:hypothetical protein [Rickettsiales bacterium]